jgi:hypothetical protein
MMKLFLPKHIMSLLDMSGLDWNKYCEKVNVGYLPDVWKTFKPFIKR